MNKQPEHARRSIFGSLWQLESAELKVDPAFSSINSVFSLQGDIITNSTLCTVSRIRRNNRTYYVKLYHKGGEGLRRFLGKSKACNEWQNLQRFIRWGLSAARPVAYGEDNRLGFARRGVVVTEEITGSSDLASLAQSKSPLFKNPHWVTAISKQVANATRVMHDHRFAHNDLKWRNILVNGPVSSPGIHLIDCPAGAFWWGPFFEYRRVKDLACLDKVAKKTLSKSQRLRFYFYYRGIYRLGVKDKIILKKVLAFFKGRE